MLRLATLASTKPKGSPKSHVVEALTRDGHYYTDAEMAVALVLATAMGWDTERGEFNCYLLIDTIAKRRQKSRRAVQRALEGLCVGPRRILTRTVAPRGKKLRTRGRAHKCNRYSLLLDGDRRG